MGTCKHNGDFSLSFGLELPVQPNGEEKISSLNGYPNRIGKILETPWLAKENQQKITKATTYYVVLLKCVMRCSIFEF